MPNPDPGQGGMTWLAFALMTVASWGVYGVFLHKGQAFMADPINGRYKASEAVRWRSSEALARHERLDRVSGLFDRKAAESDARTGVRRREYSVLPLPALRRSVHEEPDPLLGAFGGYGGLCRHIRCQPLNL